MENADKQTENLVVDAEKAGMDTLQHAKDLNQWWKHLLRNKNNKITELRREKRITKINKERDS